MATPIGHALVGYTVYGFSAAPTGFGRLHLAFLAIGTAIIPDLDFLPGFLMGKPNLYHQGITHSLLFALVVSLGIATVYSSMGKSFFRVFNLCFVSYLSHLLIDLFGPDTRLPYGQPLFWPISDQYFISPVQLLLGARHTASTYAPNDEWIKSIFNIYNVRAIALEVIIFAPFAILAQQYKKHVSYRRAAV